MKITRYNVVFPKKETAELVEETLDLNLTGDEVLVKTIYDVISTGTELANYRDLPNTSVAQDVQGKFPRIVGYSFSAEVVACGPGVRSLVPGDKVIVGWGGHRSMIVKREKDLLPLTSSSLERR